MKKSIVGIMARSRETMFEHGKKMALVAAKKLFAKAWGLFWLWFFMSRSFAISSIALALIAACALYGLLRWGGKSTRAILQRGTAFLVSVMAIALLFFTLEFFIEKFFYHDDEVVDIIASVAGVFVFSRVKSYFETITDSIFFRRRYDYADATARASEAFSSTIDLVALAAAAEEFLGSTIKPTWTDFFRMDSGTAYGFSPVSEESSAAIFDEGYREIVQGLFEEGDRGNLPVTTENPEFLLGKREGKNTTGMFSKLGIGAIVPTFSRGRMNALLVLGRKKSGDSMDARDHELLELISRQMGMAVENAELYAAARRHAESLEQRVAERTERIKGMYEAQSKFLGDLSHEFQTPLTILKMNVEAFAGNSLAERRKAAYVMETTLDRLSRLTSGLVDIARFNFSRETWQRERVDLSSLLKATCGDCFVLAKNKDVTISWESEKDIAVSGDRDKLKEVLLNLVSNALKHTSAGGSVALSARRKESDAEIMVIDSGAGIPAKNLSRIFERFYRMNDGVSEGTGLGLHLCRKIVEAHGGTIIAESSVGKGSRFVIHVPLAASEIGGRRQSAQAEKSDAPPPP